MRPDLNRLGLKLIQKYYQSADGADLSADLATAKIDNFLQDTNGLTEVVIEQHSDWLLKTKKEMKISHKKYFSLDSNCNDPHDG